MMRTDLTKAHHQTLQLREGRMLGYAEYGQPSGKALFYFGASRLEARLLAEQAAQAGIRLIGIDRPGMGLSQFQPHRHLLDWPDDVVALADHLQIEHFAVMGHSGGGPYALVCAYKTPDRLTACGIVSGMEPLVVFFFQRFPWLLIPMTWGRGQFFRNEAQARTSLMRFTRHWPKPERDSLLIPDMSNTLVASQAEAFRQGARGLTYDIVLIEGLPWGFRLEDITFPKLFLWHGELDTDTPIAMGHTITERIAQCRATFYPSEGHISVLANHRDEIMTVLMS
jgi:pimeloyl-ACP methyl ester carboxylesterase